MTADSKVEFEFLLDERSGHEWILRHEPRIVLPTDRYAGMSPMGLPAMAPEALLFFKAGGQLGSGENPAERGAFRPHDEQDFVALLPLLDETRRRWLHDSLAAAQPEHPWLPTITR